MLQTRFGGVATICMAVLLCALIGRPCLSAENSAADIARQISLLNQPDQKTRIAALSALGAAGDPSAIEPMSKIALSDDPLSDLARQNIAKIGGPRAATCLIAMLNRHVMGGEAGSIAGDLAAIGDNRAVAPVIQLLHGELIGHRQEQDASADMEKIWARQNAAEALGRFRDPTARAALQRAVAEDPDWDVYFAANQALRQMDQPLLPDVHSLIVDAVEKQPEPPEGAEEYARKWNADHPDSQRQWVGPLASDYAPATLIARNRKQLIDYAGSPYLSNEIIENLMCYFGSRRKIDSDHVAEAQALIIRIGAPAIPELKIGLQRGDGQMKQYCQKCLDAIASPPTTRPGQ